MARSKAKKKNEEELAPVSMTAPKKLQLLFTVVNKEKTEFYQDLLQGYEANLQMILSAHGTYGLSQASSLLGLTDSDRSVIISVVRRERVNEIMTALDEKFKTVKGGKGVAYTVPMTSTIGVAIYQFLSNTNNGGII